MKAPSARRRRVLAAPAGLAVAVLAAGCGFRLRGTSDLPFATLYTTFAPGSALGDDFRRELARGTSTRIVTNPDEAEVRLMILGENRERDIVAYSVVGRPREYQLRLRLRFAALGRGEREFIQPSEIILRRDISAADNQLTARLDEEALLYRDMQKDMVQQLLRRLGTIRVDG